MSSIQPTDDPLCLRPALRGLPGSVRRLFVGYSGGLDSTVLLHALAAQRDTLGGRTLLGVHVNHGLHPAAASWAAHCRDICRAWQIPLAVLAVDARPRPGESPEAAARRQRYAAIAGLLGAADLLLVAHHQDDQAETVLLNLTRGSGVTGMGAMRRYRILDTVAVLRPLLDVPRRSLMAYARRYALKWIDDPANRDPVLYRNFIRHRLLAPLNEHRIGSSAAIARTARNLQDAADCLEELADIDLAACSRDGELSIEHLLGLSPPRQRNLLVAWLQRRGLPAPQSRHLEQLLHQLRSAASDAQVEIRWSSAVLRRHRGHLYALRRLPPTGDPWRSAWNIPTPLPLPDGMLLARASEGHGLRAELCRSGRVEVRLRQGGERCVPAPGGRHRSLKKLLQEMGEPPWVRARMPLVYVDDELACIADRLVCDPYRAGAGERGWALEWRLS